MDLNLYYNTDPNEKPLDHPVTDGGYCGILRTIACVGDSLSSGEFESNMDGKIRYHDYYDYSWGQYLARMAGCTVYNFSAGGMTARAYCEGFADSRGFWNANLAAQAYIIALGVNDLLYQKHECGSVEDICLEDYRKNKSTFYGDYARIIQRYKEIQPRARFFLVTVPDIDEGEENNAAAELQRKAVYEIAALFDHTFVIDLNKYGPAYHDEFRETFYVGGHMTPAGYMLTARMMASYIDYIIRHNPDEFRQIGFVGTPYCNEKANGAT